VCSSDLLTKFERYLTQALQHHNTNYVPAAYKNLSKSVSTNANDPNLLEYNRNKYFWTLTLGHTLKWTFMPFMHDMKDVLTRLSRSPAAFKDPYNIMPGTHLARQFGTWIHPLGLQRGWKRKAYARMRNNGSPVASNSYCAMYHHGIYLGNGWVIGHPEGLKRIQEFTVGSENLYEVRYADPDSAKKIVGRGIQQALQDLFIGTPTLGHPSASTRSITNKHRSTTGMHTYSPFTRNCEHFATLITTGTPTSMTLLRIALVPMSLAAIGVSLLARWKYTKGMTRNRIAQIHEMHLAGLSPWKRWMKLSEITKARDLALAAARS